MFYSNLLGLVKKPIFEILYRSALRAAIQLEESGLEFKTFAVRFLRLARAETLKIDVVDKERHHYLVEKTVWLIVIPPDRDLQAIRAEFLERLVHTHDVVGAFVLVSSFPPRWGWAQVSEGKRMKAQACKVKLLEEQRESAAALVSA
jgi:hypothetical protein